MIEERQRPRVLVVSLGGTIASTSASSSTALTFESGVVPQLNAHDLISGVPGLDLVADIVAVSFRQLSSGDLTFCDVVDLAALIERSLGEGVDGVEGIDGVVVTQGTDTIEETSFALDVLLDVSAPVVVTGAMRNPTLAGPDGPANILAAVKVAASPQASGLGCVVVFNDEVHAARFVRKTHSSSTATFQSPSAGPLGWVAEERVRIVMRPTTLANIRVDFLEESPPVALVSCALGDDGRTLEELESLGYRGVVVDAFGAGHVPSAMVGHLESLATRMPVILCSRSGSGEVFAHTYGFAGSESDVLSRGVTSGGLLDGRKARVALTLALAASVHSAHALELFSHLRDSVSDWASER